MIEVDLLHYRRRVADSYAGVRGGTGESAWTRWVADRDDLFGTHPQSPIEPATPFSGLRYFDYDPAWRFEATVEPAKPVMIELNHSGEGSTRFRRFGTARFGDGLDLAMYWLDAYGGGVFVPFGDLTNGSSTYGGGRYLLDTAKGADLGSGDGSVVFDFNYAYHPSCVHSARWSCPLPPAESRLGVAAEAGERL